MEQGVSAVTAPHFAMLGQNMKRIIMHLLIGHFPPLPQIFISFSVDNVDVWVKIC